MASNISAEQVKQLKNLIAQYAPYPIEILDDYMFDDKQYDENRIDATIAKKILTENNISD